MDALTTKEFIELTLKILGAAGAVVAFVWGVIVLLRNWIDSGDHRINERVTAEITARERLEKDLNDKIDKMKDSHVRREDLADLKTTMTAMTSNINNRMDNILNVLMRMGTNDNKL